MKKYLLENKNSYKANLHCHTNLSDGKKTPEEVKALYNVYNEGWSKLSGAVRGKKILTTLSVKEREVAKLAAFGLSNQEIADKLGISVSIVKQAIRIVSEKSGLPRSNFAAIL